MSPKLKQLCQVYTTPRQLREIADRMERYWLNARAGESTLAHTIYGADLNVEFYVDQYELGREKV